MSLQLGAVKQLVLSIRQKICGVIRNVRECVRREAFPHTHYTVVHVERKSLQSEKPRSKITQCARAGNSSKFHQAAVMRKGRGTHKKRMHRRTGKVHGQRSLDC